MKLAANVAQTTARSSDCGDTTQDGARANTVSWQLREDIGCLHINCAVDADTVCTSLSQALDGPIPREAGTTQTTPVGRWLWLTPRAWLLQCGLADEMPLAARINARFMNKLVHAATVGDGLSWFDLTGTGATTLLSQGGFVTLEPEQLQVGRVKRTIFAGVAVVLVPEPAGSWQLGIERSRARYLTDWIRSAVQRSTALDHPSASQTPTSSEDA